MGSVYFKPAPKVETPKVSARVPWFSRRFNFDFPVGYYADLIERLRGTPVRVEALLRGIPADVLLRREGNTWSIKENAGHLGDLEPLGAGRVDDILKGISLMRAAELTNRKTHEANHNDTPTAQLVGAFALQRQVLVGRLESLDAEAFAKSSLHPRLKTGMRLVDLCLFIADHDDYHLARISELRRLFNVICVQ